MNKKGFTLVEVLAVVVLLAIIMLIAIPNVWDSLSATKNKISEIEKKQLIEGAETAVLGALDCEKDNYIYIVAEEELKEDGKTANCKDVKEKLINDGITIDVSYLQDSYLNNQNTKCIYKGQAKVKVSENYEVLLDLQEGEEGGVRCDGTNVSTTTRTTITSTTTEPIITNAVTSIIRNYFTIEVSYFLHNNIDEYTFGCTYNKGDNQYYVKEIPVYNQDLNKPICINQCNAIGCSYTCPFSKFNTYSGYFKCRYYNVNTPSSLSEIVVNYQINKSTKKITIIK